MRPNQFLKQYLPSSHQLRDSAIPRYFSEHIRDPLLWHLNRHSVARGVAIGLFCAYLPMPFETLPAIIAALAWRANLPISIVLVWISNPLTWVPLWGPPYLLGTWLIGEPVIPIASITMAGLSQHLYALWLGCLIFALIAAVIGYYAVHIIWRFNIKKLWERRRQRRRLRKTQKRQEGEFTRRTADRR